MEKNLRNNESTIFVIPVLDKYLLYAPLHNLSVLLNLPALKLVKSSVEGGRENPGSTELADLVSVLQTAPVFPDRTGEPDPDFLGIIPSRRCNMSCIYCDFGAGCATDEVIDPDVVTAAIDYFAELRKKNSKRILPLQFFGGEPFVEKEIIDIAVHHARYICSQNGMIPHFNVLSNGYLSNEKRVFIKDYFDSVVISFDGYKKYHDRTRPVKNGQGSFDNVAESIKYFSKSNLELAIRCCITSESVDDMENMARWFCAEFDPDIVNFETLTCNIDTEKAMLYPPDPYKFAAGSVRSWRVLRKNFVTPAYAPLSPDKSQTTSCPVGRDVLIVHPDGIIASCYLQRERWEEKRIDLNVGSVPKTGNVEIDVDKLTNLRNRLYTKPRCRNCFCRFGCAGNCHVNCTYPGSPDEYTDFCIQTRLITICSLLEDMDLLSVADELLEDRTAQSKLALNRSDNIFSIEEWQ